jgi:adenine-specific DNA-methyltransferase
VSRLNDLLRELRTREPALARDLEREVAALADRRAFGLNFERHVPEAVELPGRKARKGDKVRILTPRGQMPKRSDERLWRVVGIDRSARTASLERLIVPVPDSAEPATKAGDGGHETRTAELDDLVVVAEFRDPIYPGLVSTGRVERGGDRPFHTIINAENFHALETLLFTHRGTVDCIYIDPPYNNGKKDWKYNNDYVEGDDLYRHSKWLAMMERRLLLAKQLLDPRDSVLIVTIDEKEYLRLGLLLEQIFSGARIQMVSIGINPASVARNGYFGRSDEYAFFVMSGDCGVTPTPLPPEWIVAKGRTHGGEIRWDLLRKSGSSPTRAGHPGTFYPVIVTADARRVLSIGDPIGEGAPRDGYVVEKGALALWPIRDDGSEGRWAVGPTVARALLAQGYLKLGRAKGSSTAVYYLAKGERQKITDGIYEVLGRSEDGSVMTSALADSSRRIVPGTQWRISAHDSTQYGSRLLAKFVLDRKFPFPKSVYAVEDTLRFFLLDKPDAIVVDFFAGSGTTTHAVFRLNRQDRGRRRSIIVTNNEVSAEEQVSLRARHLRPGDPEWERWGICEYITKPRIQAAITGKTPNGESIKGDYKFADEFCMADGFSENVEFFNLTYEAPLRVASNREFTRIAPLLWLRAGARGRRIDNIAKGWDVADVYGVLADLDHTEEFLKAIASNDNVAIAYLVTDEDLLFESVAQELPGRVEPVRLYEAYLRNFEIESGRGSL